MDCASRRFWNSVKICASIFIGQRKLTRLIKLTRQQVKRAKPDKCQGSLNGRSNMKGAS